MGAVECWRSALCLWRVGPASCLAWLLSLSLFALLYYRSSYGVPYSLSSSSWVRYRSTGIYNIVSVVSACSWASCLLRFFRKRQKFPTCCSFQLSHTYLSLASLLLRFLLRAGYSWSLTVLTCCSLTVLTCCSCHVSLLTVLTCCKCHVSLLTRDLLLVTFYARL